MEHVHLDITGLANDRIHEIATALTNIAGGRGLEPGSEVGISALSSAIRTSAVLLEHKLGDIALSIQQHALAMDNVADAIRNLKEK